MTSAERDLRDAIDRAGELVGWTTSRSTTGGWMVTTPRGILRLTAESKWDKAYAERALRRLHSKGFADAKTGRAGGRSGSGTSPVGRAPQLQLEQVEPPFEESESESEVRVRRGAEVPGYDGDPWPEEGEVLRVVDLTPELADHLIRRPWEAISSDGRHLRQRPLTQARLDEIRALILRGELRRTHQGLAIGENGSLYDGQHRCHAVRETGMTVKTLVAYNQHPDLLLAIDSGLQRRSATKLGMAGYDHPLWLGSAARALYYVLEYEAAVTLGDTEQELVRDWRLWHHQQVIDLKVVDTVHAHPGLPLAVNWVMARKPKRINVPATAVFRYLVLRACGPGIEERLNTFLDAFIVGIGIESADHPAKAARDWAEGDFSIPRRYRREAYLFVLCKAWKRWTTGRGLKRIDSRLGGTFHLPQKLK